MTVVAQFARILDHSRERLLCDTGEGSSHVSNSEQTSEVDMFGVCLTEEQLNRRGIREFFFGRRMKNEKNSTARPPAIPDTHYQSNKKWKGCVEAEKNSRVFVARFRLVLSFFVPHGTAS